MDLAFKRPGYVIMNKTFSDVSQKPDLISNSLESFFKVCLCGHRHTHAHINPRGSVQGMKIFFDWGSVTVSVLRVFSTPFLVMFDWAARV